MTPASSDDGKNRDDARFQWLHVVAHNDERPDDTTPFCSERLYRAILRRSQRQGRLMGNCDIAVVGK
jgi:hypothetical protein